jgi:hypothetical protein
LASKHIVSQLVKRYAKLLGTHDAADRYIEGFHGVKAIREATERIDEYKVELRRQMSEIAGSLRQFEPSFKIASIRPIRPKQQQFAYGSISKIIFETLREEARPLKIREISRVVAEKMELPLEEAVLLRFDKIAYLVLNYRAGTVFRGEGDPMQWSILGTDEV